MITMTADGTEQKKTKEISMSGHGKQFLKRRDEVSETNFEYICPDCNSRYCYCDSDQGAEDFGPERFRDGTRNHARDKALERNARFVYELDRD